MFQQQKQVAMNDRTKQQPPFKRRESYSMCSHSLILLCPPHLEEALAWTTTLADSKVSHSALSPQLQASAIVPSSTADRQAAATTTAGGVIGPTLFFSNSLRAAPFASFGWMSDMCGDVGVPNLYLGYDRSAARLSGYLPVCLRRGAI